MPISNRLSVVFNHDTIEKGFDFFLITTSEKFIPYGSYLLDKPQSSLRALSLVFDGHKKAYVLFKKGTISRIKLAESIDDEAIALTTIHPSDISDQILLRLFLYSLCNYQSDENVFNNLAGSLFIYQGEYKRSNSFSALSIDVDPQLCIDAVATTFTKAQVFKSNKKVLANYPKYKLEANGKLRRVLADESDKDAYINKGFRNSKNEIPFLILNSSKIRDTRAYFIQKTVAKLNERYKDYLYASFSDVKKIETIGEKRDKDFVRIAKRELKESPISMINLVHDSTNQQEFGEVRQSLEESLHKRIKVSDSLHKNVINIVFLHNKSFYETQATDPYKHLPRKAVVQCITLEDSANKIIHSKTAVINTIIKEVAIKKDIVINSRVGLDDWSSFFYTGDWIFGTEKDGIKYFMTIHPDGSFSFDKGSIILNYFSDKNLQQLASRMDSQNSSLGNTIISDSCGNIITISQTNEFVLPNPEIYSINEISRSNESRQKLLDGVVDINLFEREGKIFYNAGMVGSGMNTSIPKAALLYQVDVLQGQNIISNILRMMSVMFVKYNSFTVLPYPLKYLREYIDMDLYQ